VFPVRSVPRLYNEDQLPLRESLETAEEYTVGVRWPPACEGMNPGIEEIPLLESATKQRSEDREWEH
jgi:hypothetical protein